MHKQKAHISYKRSRRNIFVTSDLCRQSFFSACHCNGAACGWSLSICLPFPPPFEALKTCWWDFQEAQRREAAQSSVGTISLPPPPSLPSPAEPFCPFAKRREATFWPKDPFVPLLPASSCKGPFVRGAVSLLFYLRRALSPPNLNGPEEGNKMYHVYKREYRHERCKRYYKSFLHSTSGTASGSRLRIYWRRVRGLLLSLW